MSNWIGWGVIILLVGNYFFVDQKYEEGAKERHQQAAAWHEEEINLLRGQSSSGNHSTASEHQSGRERLEEFENWKEFHDHYVTPELKSSIKGGFQEIRGDLVQGLNDFRSGNGRLENKVDDLQRSMTEGFRRLENQGPRPYSEIAPPPVPVPEFDPKKTEPAAIEPSPEVIHEDHRHYGHQEGEIDYGAAAQCDQCGRPLEVEYVDEQVAQPRPLWQRALNPLNLKVVRGDN